MGTVVGRGCGGDSEEIEEEIECESDGDAGDNFNFADEVEVVGKDITKEEGSGLEREGRIFHGEVEVLGHHSTPRTWYPSLRRVSSRSHSRIVGFALELVVERING